MWTATHIYNMTSLTVEFNPKLGGDGRILIKSEKVSDGLQLCLTIEEARTFGGDFGAALEAAAKASIAVPEMFPHPSAKGAPHVELVAE